MRNIINLILKMIFGSGDALFKRLNMEEDLFWEYPKLQLDISNKKLKIGQGAYGTVFEETYNNQKIALKKIRTLDEQSVLKIKREINIMEILKDVRQIVQFIGICRSERYVFIAMKLAENKSLFDYIRQEGQNLDWKYAKRFVYDVAIGLSHLHEIHIYHGDIKAENVLIDAGLRAKLCDFGVSKNDRFSINTGTPGRRSPERIRSNNDSSVSYKPDKDDIYALGLLMIEIALSKLEDEDFYPLNDFNKEYKHILQHEKMPKNYLDIFINFLKNEKDRPFAKQAVKDLEHIIEFIDIDRQPLLHKNDEALLVNTDDDEYKTFKDIERKALEGDISCQLTLGKYYYNGYGTHQNYEQAKLWYTKAAEAGDAGAQNNLGVYYENVEINYEQVKLWYTKAAEAGEADAQYNLGHYYNEIEKDYEQAKLWYIKAAEAGHTSAQHCLGFYANAEKNYEQAKTWYTKAAEAGNTDSQCNLGVYYYKKKNYEQAKLWWTKAAEAGDPDAQNNLGYYYDEIEKNYEQTKLWWTKAAEAGIADAQTNLGIYYENVEINYEQVKLWYTKAAEAGDPHAQNGLGYYYKDIEKDYDKAKEMYLLAINQGAAYAMHSLGEYYQDIEKDYDKAMEWYQKYIEAGLDDGDGEQGIGHCYYHNKNHHRAREWYSKAIDRGCIEAYADIGQIYLSEGDKEAAFDWYLKGAEAGDEDAKNKLQEINRQCAIS